MTRRAAPCRVLVEQLSACMEGDLPARERRRLETHAATCPTCAEALAELRSTIDACRKAAGAPLPASVRRKARDRIRRLMG